MSPYEIALTVFGSVLLCILVWDNVRLRARIEREENDIDWLKVTVKNTIRVHQETMDRHTAAIKRLDEQTGTIAARAEKFRQEQPPFHRLRADMDRLLAADAKRQMYSQRHLEGLLREGQEEAWRADPF